MNTVPLVVLEHIFSFLSNEDLWTCLGVSRIWRRIANINSLWKKHCNKLGIHSPLNLPLGERSLCPWALTYYHCYQRPQHNWKTGKYKTLEIRLEDKDNFIDFYEERQGLVYYYLTDKLFYYEIDVNSVKSYQFNCFEDIPHEKHTISLTVNKDYLAVCKYNAIIIFKRINELYEKHKLIELLDSELEGKNDVKISDWLNEKIVSFNIDYCLQIKFMSKDILWVSESLKQQIYIINLKYYQVKILPWRIVKQCSPSPFITTFDEDIILYDINGNEILQLDAAIWSSCIYCNYNVLAFGNRRTQRIEIWDIQSKTQLMTKAILYQTDMVLHPQKDLIILNEKTRDLNRFTCINARSGEIIWRFLEANEKKSRILKIVSQYLLVVFSQMDRLMYSLREVSNGKLVKQGLVPQDHDKPVAQNISTLMWVYIEHNQIKIRNFI